MNSKSHNALHNEIYYRINWKTQTFHPGAHRAKQQTSGGFEVIGYNPFSDGQDPRRFDIRATIRDPFQRIMVKRYNHFSSADIVVVADLSASTDFFGYKQNKRETMADFVFSLSISVIRSGDKFSFYGADEAILPQLHYPPTRNAAVSEEIASRIKAVKGGGMHSEGLIEIVSKLPRQKSLVFLMSDFYFDKELLETLLSELAGHNVVPVVLRDSLESQKIRRFGVVRFRDSETGGSRSLFMRPGMKKLILEKKVLFEKQLLTQFNKFGLRPLIIQDRFIAHQVTEYFLRD